jgi:transposase
MREIKRTVKYCFYDKKITDRLCEVSFDLEDLTLVFDRGNNSKSNLPRDILKIHYVGALSPSHHKDLMKEAIDYIDKKEQNRDDNVICFRVKPVISG